MSTLINNFEHTNLHLTKTDQAKPFYEWLWARVYCIFSFPIHHTGAFYLKLPFTYDLLDKVINTKAVFLQARDIFASFAWNCLPEAIFASRTSLALLQLGDKPKDRSVLAM